MADWLRVLLYAAAVFRVTLLLYEENGPWNIFGWVRAKAGIIITLHPEPELHTTVEAEGFFAELLNCPYCLSGWLAAAAAAAYSMHWWPAELTALWLGIWGLVHLVYKLLYI